MSVDLDRQLQEYSRRMDEKQGAITFEDIMERAGEVQVIPGRGTRQPPVRRRLVTAAVAVLAVTLLLVGLALLTQADPPVQPVETPSTTIDSTTPPNLEDTGSLETELGVFDWIHLRGTSQSLPYPDGGFVATPTGFVAISHELDPVTSESVRPQIWYSENGRDWYPGALPTVISPENARVQELGGEAWLMTTRPETLWRSQDGLAWSEVELPEDPSLETATLHDANGIWLMGSDLWRLDGTTWSLIEDSTPWADLATRKKTLVHDGQLFHAFVEIGQPTPRLRWWSSEDGTRWVGEGAVATFADEAYLAFTEHSGVVLAEADYYDRTHVWASQGGAFEEVFAPRSSLLAPIVFDHGWVFVEDRPLGPNQMWLSSDPLSWPPVDSPVDISSVDMRSALDGRGLAGFGAGNLILFVADDESGGRDMWVWELRG